MEETLKQILSELKELKEMINNIDIREKEHFNVLRGVIEKVDSHAVKIALIESERGG